MEGEAKTRVNEKPSKPNCSRSPGAVSRVWARHVTLAVHGSCEKALLLLLLSRSPCLPPRSHGQIRTIKGNIAPLDACIGTRKMRGGRRKGWCYRRLLAFNRILVILMGHHRFDVSRQQSARELGAFIKFYAARKGRRLRHRVIKGKPASNFAWLRGGRIKTPLSLARTLSTRTLNSFLKATRFGWIFGYLRGIFYGGYNKILTMERIDSRIVIDESRWWKLIRKVWFINFRKIGVQHLRVITESTIHSVCRTR